MDRPHVSVAISSLNFQSIPPYTGSFQLARYLYYTGRVKAVQLEYTDAFRNLQQAARKAPQQSALGFRKTVYKFSVIVQLLLGEIPDRSIFSQKGMVSSLRPYLDIAQVQQTLQYPDT